MRIVLDIRFRTRSGAASYIDNIVPGLTRNPGRHEFLVIRGHGQVVPPGTDCESVELRRASAASQAVQDQLLLPRLLRRLGADIYHPLKQLGTLFPPCPELRTAHSITRAFRGQFPIGRMEGLYWNVAGTYMYRHSAAVIAVSEFVRDFLVEVIGVEESRITVVHLGVDATFRRLDPPDGTAVTSEPPYLLTVGNIFPVKNFVVAVHVLAALAREFPQLRLKMAGSTAHPYCQRVREAAQSAGVLDRIDFLGFTPRDRLVPLMNNAELLLMPSLTEGFALALLEAMACGTAVVASARGAIPEVGADGVRLVNDPNDRPAWIESVADLLRDEAALTQLRERAEGRARQFSWQCAVEGTLGVYDLLAERGRAATPIAATGEARTGTESRARRRSSAKGGRPQ